MRLFLLGLLALPCFCQTPQYLYAANESSDNLSAYSINGLTGALTAIPGSPYALGGSPASVTLDPTGRFLFVTDPRGYAVLAYAIDPSSGVPIPVAGSPFTITKLKFNSALVDPAGRFLYVGENGGGGVIYAIDSRLGVLTPWRAGVASTSMVFHPTGQFLYAGANNQITTYAVNAVTGELTLPVSNSSGGLALAVSPDGKYLYSSSPNGLLYVNSINPATAALTPIPGSPFTVGKTSPDNPFIAIDPTGRFLYYPLEAQKVITGILLNPDTGAPEAPLPGGPFIATLPSALAFDATGRLYAAGAAKQGVVTGFNVDPVTGALSKLVGSPVPAGDTPIALAIGTPVTPGGNLASMSLLPGSETLNLTSFGQTIRYLASGSFDDGSTRFLTASAAWSSSNPAVAAVVGDAGPNQGLVTIAGQGTTTITATVDGINGTATITVNEPALASIQVAPQNPVVLAGTAIQLKAVGTYTDGSRKTLTNAVWTSGTPAVATINASGLATGIAPGTSTIQAEVAPILGSTPMTVQ